MEGPGHMLSLKVMRVSRPSLAGAWEPFYSSSPSFSAHSTASILSLQGKTPLPLHPKTLRDLTHTSEILTLPSSFGAIQLGETFTSCLCVNNETEFDVEGVRLRVEMQTANTKVVLAEFGGPDCQLIPGDTLENVVSHEIKELGQHVLGCTVSYRVPPNVRHPPGSAEDPNDPALQTFRKFYKFAASNPLSVKTKVHSPRSPSAMVSPPEREKIFLEVHIQNLMPDPVWFERMQFQCIDDWQVQDINCDDSVFSGSMALMQPQDMRQYIYILTPTAVPLASTPPTPGSTMPLGRLDISWRSSFGEPGRLLTSMLSRRIPAPAPAPALAQPTASALPAYLKRNQSIASIPSRPLSPLSRPGSPFNNRAQPPVPVRTQTPAFSQSNQALITSDIEVTLVVRSVPRESIHVEKPFKLSCSLVVLGTVVKSQTRTLRLVVQRLQPPRVIQAPPSFNAHPPQPQSGAFSPRAPSSGFSTPSQSHTGFNVALAHNKILAAAPRQSLSELPNDVTREPEESKEGTIVLPPPYFSGSDELRAPLSAVKPLGQSTLYLPPVSFSSPSSDTSDPSTKVQAVQDFELDYIALQEGFTTVGGLRALLVEDKVDSEMDRGAVGVRILKEWDIIAEILVQP
ncbi:hypothetical protein CCMSSC00406_0008699 [Pleurotus cornucopiae]|uniref:Uncharacterized protein n=1 Tax=Pleurotus cornucopiae TaxID=5321 RepID=A0ACB7J6A7_PLECO|nr:hypothetical protein CCMSSC00406_0008699 [Pleurotus cornucopiae]